jgi:hypothetical protein
MYSNVRTGSQCIAEKKKVNRVDINFFDHYFYLFIYIFVFMVTPSVYVNSVYVNSCKLYFVVHKGTASL